MIFDKKRSFLILFLVIIFSSSLTCLAQEPRNEAGFLEDGIDPRVSLWTRIQTTTGLVGVPVGSYVPGASSYYVKLLQATLNSLGFSCGTADGVYGTNTKNGIMNFQRNYQLQVDGIAGDDTWTTAGGVVGALGISVEFQK